jgi:hypothetical protein
MGTLGSGRYAPYAQRPHGRFVHHVEGHKHSWSKEFLEAGKKRLAGDTSRQATSVEVKGLRSEMRDIVRRQNIWAC